MDMDTLERRDDDDEGHRNQKDEAVQACTGATRRSVTEVKSHEDFTLI